MRAAQADGTKLAIAGGGSKSFYGEAAVGEPLDVTGLAGISSYEPTELVVTARCGTRLAELEAVLAERGQCLPFEPPHFGPGATVGGMVAAGLSGPSRAAVGAVRDYMLGATLLNGRGEVLSFGGQVMKNVAGYDVSRLLAGSLGTLGVILEVSLKVLPVALATATLRFELDESGGARPAQCLGRPAAAGQRQRLAGRRAAPAAARRARGGRRRLREARRRAPRRRAGRCLLAGPARADRRLSSPTPGAMPAAAPALWRLSLPQTAAPLGLDGAALHEWGGAQRWLCSDAPAALAARAPRRRPAAMPRSGSPPTGRNGVFTPPEPPLDRIHRQLKRAFDPAGLFNPGRLYPGL